ncbi:MAG: TauD/TfdA family dioxygenase [Acidobacteriota bacterium]
MRQPIHHDAVWRGDELTHHPDWTHTLSDDEIAEITQALSSIDDRGIATEDITRDDFALPHFGAKMASVQQALEDGPGGFFLRGWPSERFDETANTRVFWGLSRHLGTPISQSATGERIFHVRDAGFGKGHAKARGPNTRNALRFHCDRCDVIGFLCLNQARTGGENFLISSIVVHNEILARRPDLLDELYRPWYYKTHNVDTSNPDPWCHQPIFAIEDGHFVGYVLRVLIDRAYELPELPDMTAKQKEALDFLDAVCAEPELHYSFRQAPGDMLFVNNFSTFHSRSEFEDWDEPEKRRHLLRIWLSVPNSRPLPASFAGSFGRTGAGEIRGGIHPT